MEKKMDTMMELLHGLVADVQNLREEVNTIHTDIDTVKQAQKRIEAKQGKTLSYLADVYEGSTSITVDATKPLEEEIQFISHKVIQLEKDLYTLKNAQ